jgi:hypothetical protein
MYQLTLNVTKALHQDHLTTLALLERLESLFGQFPAKRVPPFDDVGAKAVFGDLAKVLDNEVGSHFLFEEEHLFPRFIEVAGEGIPSMLRDEHEAIRPLARHLADLARGGLAEGFSATSWAEFHREGRQLIEREVFHVQKEEMGFLPALDQFLSNDDDAALFGIYAGTKDGI